MPQRAGQLGDPVAAGVGGVDQPDDGLPRDRSVDLGKSGDDLTGLAGDGKRIERRTDQEPLGLLHQSLRNRQLPLEAAGEHVARHRVP